MYRRFMNATLNNLPNDIDTLKNIIKDLSYQVDHLTKTSKEQHQTIQCLEEEKKLLLHRLFGKKSEKLTAEDILQGRLFDEAEVHIDNATDDSDAATTTVQSHTRKKTGKKPLPADLPRVDIIHDIAEEEKHCPCGCELTKIGEEVSEKLDLVPAKIEVHRHIRYKYACKKCEGTADDGPAVKTAPMPKQMVPQGIVSHGLLAWSLVSKFCDAIPFYRQEKLFARIGVELSRATFCNWSRIAYDGCVRLLDLMWDDVLHSPLVGMDETSVQVMNEINRKNTTKSYMWVFRGGGKQPVIMFKYNPTRSSEFVNTAFSDYAGVIQTDGYQGYNDLGSRKNVTHAACWAHVRRKFMEAMKGSGNSPVANSIVDQIKKLYAVESEIGENKYGSDEIKKVRHEKSRPVVEAIERQLQKQVNAVAPKSLTGKAISYALELWPRLCVFLDNPIVSIDNNPVENAIRPFVVGRKNWLFSGSPRGAHASAGIYCIIETAKANGLEPYWYLRYLFEKLPACIGDDEIRLLMPNRIDPHVIDQYRGGVN